MWSSMWSRCIAICRCSAPYQRSVVSFAPALILCLLTCVLPRIRALREQLCSAGLRLVRQEIVTANVFAALDYDHERKRALINEKIPANSCAISTIRGALRDSPIYQAIRERRAEYVSYVFRKEI